MTDVSSGGWSRSPEGQRRYDLVGGLILAGCALVLFATSFLTRTPVPLAVQASIIVFAAVGLAVAFNLLRVTNPQDFYGGMALVGLALVAFVASNDLPGMRGFAFGPGTAPRLFAFTLAALSVLVVLSGLMSKGPQISRYNIRGTFFIIAAILTFAATIRPMGLVFATFVTVLICAAATEDVKWKESVIWAVILTTFCSFLFPYGLALPFMLWPAVLIRGRGNKKCTTFLPTLRWASASPRPRRTSCSA
jgi:putative tricarboxylic transport membrane protein